MKRWTVILLAMLMVLCATMPAFAEATTPSSLTAWLNHTWYPTDKFEGIIPEIITEKTGVTLVPTRAVDASQLGLLIGSGDLMDLTFTSEELARLSNSDLCYSYSELIEKYCPDWKPDPTAIVNASSFSTDGDYYFLFSHAFTNEEWKNAKGGVPSTGSLHYREDIAKELGFDVPSFTTFEELDALFAAVHAKYPEMEILTYGPVMAFEYFYMQFGMSTLTDWVQAPDGSYKHIINSDNYEKMMRKLNEYYRLGYINPDSFGYDESTADGLMYTGKNFAYSNVTQGYADTETSMGRQALNNPDFTVLEMNPLGADSSYRLTNLGWCGTFISKNCKDPEAAIKLMRYLYSEEGAKLTMWGREGIEYTADAEGNPVFSQEWVDTSKDEESFTTKYNTNYYFGTTALAEAIGRTSFLDEAYQNTYDKIRERIVCEPWYAMAEPKDPDSDEYVVTAKLADMLKNATTTIIMSDTDEAFVDNLAKLRENAKQTGIDELTIYMNTQLAEKAAMYK